MKQENKIQPFEFNQFLSYIDLAKHPRWNEYAEFWKEDVLKELLYDMGADLSYGYETSMVTHRPRTENKVRHCQRVTFKEREDEFWINNYMQIEDVVRCTGSEISRVGMLLAMNSERKANEVMVSKMAAQVQTVDIKVDMGSNQV